VLGLWHLGECTIGFRWQACSDLQGPQSSARWTHSHSPVTALRAPQQCPCHSMHCCVPADHQLPPLSHHKSSASLYGVPAPPPQQCGWCGAICNLHEQRPHPSNPSFPFTWVPRLIRAIMPLLVAALILAIISSGVLLVLPVLQMNPWVHASSVAVSVLLGSLVLIHFVMTMWVSAGRVHESFHMFVPHCVLSASAAQHTGSAQLPLGGTTLPCAVSAPPPSAKARGSFWGRPVSSQGQTSSQQSHMQVPEGEGGRGSSTTQRQEQEHHQQASGDSVPLNGQGEKGHEEIGGEGTPAHNMLWSYPQGCFADCTFCMGCNAAKPASAHHCRSCNVCVVEMGAWGLR